MAGGNMKTKETMIHDDSNNRLTMINYDMDNRQRNTDKEKHGA